MLRVPLELEVAFARDLLEFRAIEDFDLAAARLDGAADLERMGDHRDRGALDAQDVGATFLGHIEDWAVERVARLQKPSAKPRFDRMQGVTQGILPGLKEHPPDVLPQQAGKDR